MHGLEAKKLDEVTKGVGVDRNKRRGPSTQALNIESLGSQGALRRRLRWVGRQEKSQTFGMSEKPKKQTLQRREVVSITNTTDPSRERGLRTDSWIWQLVIF